MSQLNEDGVGVAPDSSQKTITNFIITKDASRKDIDEQRTFGPDISDHDFIDDEKSDFSIGCHETHDNHRDPLDCGDSSELNDDNRILRNSGCQVEKSHKSSCDVSADKVCSYMQ